MSSDSTPDKLATIGFKDGTIRKEAFGRMEADEHGWTFYRKGKSESWYATLYLCRSGVSYIRFTYDEFPDD